MNRKSKSQLIMKHLAISTLFHLIGSSIVTAEILLGQNEQELQKGEGHNSTNLPVLKDAERKRTRPHKINKINNDVSMSLAATAATAKAEKSGKAGETTPSSAVPGGGTAPSPTPGKAGKDAKSGKMEKSGKMKKSRILTRRPTDSPTRASPGGGTKKPTMKTTMSPTGEEETETLLPTPAPPTSFPTYIPTVSPTIPTVTQSPINGLVQAPSCLEDDSGYICLRTTDFGVEDQTMYKVDLSLEVLDPTNADAYVNARRMWMEVIPGDLSSTTDNGGADSGDICNNPYPDTIDDLHICGRDVEVDGPGGVLGFARPLLGRLDGPPGTITTVAGEMAFDFEDIAGLVADGSWEGVILHEMGHIIGIGSLWTLNEVVDGDTLEYIGQNALDVWTNDWGCDGSPPVEEDGGAGTAGSHWDEDCLVDELMTGFATGLLPFSRLTIGSLEDMGYTVDYDAADEYDGSDTTCCNSSSSSNSLLLKPNKKPPLSVGGRATAVAFGQKMLNANKRPSNSAKYDNRDQRPSELEDNGLVYLDRKSVV